MVSPISGENTFKKTHTQYLSRWSTVFWLVLVFSCFTRSPCYQCSNFQQPTLYQNTWGLYLQINNRGFSVGWTKNLDLRERLYPPSFGGRRTVHSVGNSISGCKFLEI